MHEARQRELLAEANRYRLIHQYEARKASGRSRLSLRLRSARSYLARQRAVSILTLLSALTVRPSAAEALMQPPGDYAGEQEVRAVLGDAFIREMSNRHLSQLRGVGLVEEHSPDHRNIVYRVNREALSQIGPDLLAYIRDDQ